MSENRENESTSTSLTLTQKTSLYITLFLTMIIGMLAKTTYDVLTQSADATGTIQEYIIPVLISPIAFGSVLNAASKGMKIDISTYIFAFQNGFFWKTVLTNGNGEVSV